MEIAAYVLAAVATILALVVGLLANFGHRELPLWLGFVTAVLYALGICCWYQDWLWKADAQVASKVEKLRPSERAWIQLEAAKFGAIEIGKIPDYTISIKNTGQTPATITNRATGLVILGRGKATSDLNEDDMPIVDGPMESVPLAPGATAYMPVTHDIFGVPEEYKTDIDSGARKLFIVGRVRYMDINGNKCFTTICLLFEPGLKRLGIFPKFNRMECE